MVPTSWPRRPPSVGGASAPRTRRVLSGMPRNARAVVEMPRSGGVERESRQAVLPSAVARSGGGAAACLSRARPAIAGVIEVLPDGGGGAVYEHLDELPQWMAERLREPDLGEDRRHARQVAVLVA